MRRQRVRRLSWSGVAEFGGLLAQVCQVAFLGLLLIGVSPAVLIGRLVFEQMIDSAGNPSASLRTGLVGRGDQGLHWSELAFLAPVEGAKGAVAAHDTGGGLSKRLARPVVRLQRVIAQDFAARDFVVRDQTQQRAEVLLGEEATHLRADLADDGLRE